MEAGAYAVKRSDKYDGEEVVIMCVSVGSLYL